MHLLLLLLLLPATVLSLAALAALLWPNRSLSSDRQGWAQMDGRRMQNHPSQSE